MRPLSGAVRETQELPIRILLSDHLLYRIHQFMILVVYFECGICTYTVINKVPRTFSKHVMEAC